MQEHNLKLRDSSLLIVVVILVVVGVVYYLNHHDVSVKVKDDEGNKSHMTIKNK